MSDPFQSIEVVNRRKVPVEVQYSGICLVFQPGEKKAYPPNVARCIVEQSYLRLNLATGIPHTYALGIVGSKAFPADPIEGDLAEHDPIEKLDRSDEPQLTETEPKALGPDGEMSLGVGKKDKESQAPPPDEMKPLKFHNPNVRRGPQNSSGFGNEYGGSRVVSKKSE